MKQTQINLLISLTQTPYQNEQELIQSTHITLDELEQLQKQGYIKRNKVGQYLCNQQGFYLGFFSAVTANFGFVIIEDGILEDIYVANSDALNAMNQDWVLVWVFKGHDGRYAGKIIHILKRYTTTIVATVIEHKKKIYLQPLDDRQMETLKYVNPQQFELLHGLTVVGTVINYSPLTIEITKVLGHKDEPGVDVLALLAHYGIEAPFNEAVKKQARAYPQEVRTVDFEGRHDFTDKLIFTIDGEDTKDIDDAISIEKTDQGYILGVHIADVAHYVTQNSAIDLEARSRGTSVYVVDRVVPMLPVELSNRLCSLNPHVNRLAISCLIEINEQGEVVDFEILESVIRSKQKLSYREVNRYLNNPHDVVYIESEIKRALLIMDECATILRNKREKAGASEFSTIESEIVVDSLGNIIKIGPKQAGLAEKMIEDFMITANETVAGLFAVTGYPTLYRVHESPSDKKMKALMKSLVSLGYRLVKHQQHIYPKDIQKILRHFEGEPTELLIHRLVLRSMAKARYSSDNLGHFGLAIHNYCHFTSPIRRYPDLIVHRHLKRYYLHNRHQADVLEQDEKLVAELAVSTSDREQNAVMAERAVEKMKKAQFMSQFVGKKFKGTISSVTKFGFFVQLENTCEGLVHIVSLDEHFYFDETSVKLVSSKRKQFFQVGDVVKVKVLSVDLVNYEVNFKWLDHNKKEVKGKWKK